MVCALADAGWGGREWCALLNNASGCVWWSLADVVPAVGFTHAGSLGKSRSLLESFDQMCRVSQTACIWVDQMGWPNALSLVQTLILTMTLSGELADELG